MSIPWLILLSDPNGLTLPASPPTPFRTGLDKLLDVAQSHGVLPAVVSNLSAAVADGSAELIAKGGREGIESVLASKGELLRVEMAFSLYAAASGQ